VKEHVSRKCQPIEKTLTVRDAGELIQKLNLEEIDFIKIDVESLEYEIISSLTDIIKRDQPIITLEFNRLTATKFGSFDNLSAMMPGYEFYGAVKPPFAPLSHQLLLKPFDFNKNYAHLIAIPACHTQKSSIKALL